MERYKQITLAAMFVGGAAFAQPSPTVFELRPIVTRDTLPNVQGLGLCLSIGAVSINDAGEVAFSADCDGPKVFTSKRIVAREGDDIEGAFITAIAMTSPLSINSKGQVAYGALYADKKENAKSAGWPRLGIFVDNRLALALDAAKAPAHSLVLSDDGRVLIDQPETPNTPFRTQPVREGVQKRTSLFDRVKITPPKIVPITIAPSQQGRPVAQPANGKQPIPPATSLQMLHPNRRGQVAIPVNIAPGDFVILLATPIGK